MLTRRQFVKGAGVAGIGALVPVPAEAARKKRDRKALKAKPPEAPSRAWEDFYRNERAATVGDAQGYAFHCSNCQGNCAWRVYAKDGIVTREEQLAEYPQVNPHIPDANPRGCNKGAINSQAMYEKDRILYPMKRKGKRGGGKWERISWDRAIAEISEKVVDILEKHGPGGLMVYAGTGIVSQGRRAGPLRLGSLLGSVRIYPSSAVGDMFTGASIAYGIPNVGHSLDAWFETDRIILWGINPNVTRIPDAHYLWEAKYRGAKIVTISPEHSSTAIHSDLWIPIKPGTDSFLAMSMVHVILKEGLVNEAFVKEQTDLPFLVRKDSGRLLRDADLKKFPRENVFYFWDRKKNAPVEALGTMGHAKDTLRLGEADPALTGSFEVKGKDGQPIAVTTVFDRVRAEAEKFSPEATAQITGIHPSVVVKLTRDFAAAKKAGITIGFSLHKYAWGVLACWGQALACALTGHAAETGGLDTEHQWSLGGIGPLTNPKPARFASGGLSEWMSGRMWETFKTHYSDEREFAERAGIPPAEVIKIADESREKKWLAWFGEPRGRILFGDNIFRRNKSQAHYQKAVLDGTDLYVNVNFRMDSSAELADYVLPGQSHYEGWDIRGEVGYHRFANLIVPPPGLKPVGEAKSEWEICRLLAAGIEAAAKKRGAPKLVDAAFNVKKEGKDAPVVRDLDTLHDDFTMNETVKTDQDVVKWLLSNVPAFKPWKFEEAVRHGFIVLNENAGFTSPLYTDKPYHSFEEQVHLKRPYPTLSGRQTFCVDHDIFLKLGAAVPTARLPLHPKKFPLAFVSPHTRYGIHSTWRSNKYMMRLQRSEPYVYLNPALAKKKGIEDGDRVRVFNDVGEFAAMAKIHPGTPPHALFMDHAWEPHQFKGRSGMDAPVAGLLSPLELAGGWGHLKFGAEWDGNQMAYESSVDVEKA